MLEVTDGLFVGAEDSCVNGSPEYAVVHACKYPCHNAVCGNPSADHSDYLVKEVGNDLYLNMVDMEDKQQHQFMEPMVSATLEFVETHIDTEPVLIHCNQGRSRSPSLAMLYMAKRTDEISDESYLTSSREFQELYPPFSPSRGIHLYLQEYWHQLE